LFRRGVFGENSIYGRSSRSQRPGGGECEAGFSLGQKANPVDCSLVSGPGFIGTYPAFCAQPDLIGANPDPPRGNLKGYNLGVSWFGPKWAFLVAKTQRTNWVTSFLVTLVVTGGGRWGSKPPRMDQYQVCFVRAPAIVDDLAFLFCFAANDVDVPNAKRRPHHPPPVLGPTGPIIAGSGVL